MHTVILVVHIAVTVLLIGIILIQRSDGDGFGLGGGGGGLMTGRATANLLTRTTAVLATIFILTSLGLSLTGVSSGKKSLIDQLTEQQPVTSSPPATMPQAAKEPAKPAVPKPE